MNKKGQFSGIIAFVAVVIIIIFIAPLLLKVVLVPTQKFSSALATIDTTNKSSNAVNYIQNKFTGTFDWILAFFFLFNVIILLLTSFLVDVHPAFFIVYLVAVFFLVVFAPSIMDAVGNLYTSSEFTEEVSYLPIMNFIYNNFGAVIVGIIALSAIIMFGKYKLIGSGGGAVY